jgi:hypothetical protein
VRESNYFLFVLFCFVLVFFCFTLKKKIFFADDFMLDLYIDWYHLQVAGKLEFVTVKSGADVDKHLSNPLDFDMSPLYC